MVFLREKVSQQSSRKIFLRAAAYDAVKGNALSYIFNKLRENI